ncbi:putative holin-like toxin [Tissierella praeacuta]|nr:putative holin-like toxin [Tissierella praeacuta]
MISVYEALSLMIMFSTFILSLISLIVKLSKDNSKGKK